MYSESDFVVLGHKHPAIAIRGDGGFRHRFKSFLFGKVDHTTLLVLPSISPIAYRTDVNLNPTSTFLSPFLKNKVISEMVPFAIEPGIGVQKFPKLKHIF